MVLPLLVEPVLVVKLWKPGTSAPGTPLCVSANVTLVIGTLPELVAELSNGCVGYVPTEEALSASGGGYETRLTFYSNLIPEAGRRIAAAGIELTHQLTPGPMPEPPQAKPFAAPWNYGDVPAETK